METTDMMIKQIRNGNTKALYQEGNWYVIETRQKALATRKCRFADLTHARNFYKLIQL